VISPKSISGDFECAQRDMDSAGPFCTLNYLIRVLEKNWATAQKATGVDYIATGKLRRELEPTLINLARHSKRHNCAIIRLCNARISSIRMAIVKNFKYNAL
jgi:hypothetical protein